MYFNGSRTVTIEFGGDIISDPIDVDMVKGATFYEVVFVKVLTATDKWPLGLTGAYNNGNGPNNA